MTIMIEFNGYDWPFSLHSKKMAQDERTIYVRNLNFETTEPELSQAFAQFGTVTAARIITDFDRYSRQRRSRGFGFVDFQDVSSVEAALKATVELGNRKIFIDKAKPKVQHPKDTVFIGNLKEGTTEQDIRAAFPGVNIVEVRIPQPRNNSQPIRHFAFVKFESEESQKNATLGKQISILGQQVTVRIARPIRRFGLRRRRGPRRGRRAPRETQA